MPVLPYQPPSTPLPPPIAQPRFATVCPPMKGNTQCGNFDKAVPVKIGDFQDYYRKWWNGADPNAQFIFSLHGSQGQAYEDGLVMSKTDFTLDQGNYVCGANGTYGAHLPKNKWTCMYAADWGGQTGWQFGPAQML